MRILLINPPVTIPKFGVLTISPHLGLAYIAAVLERENYEVSILDALALGLDNLMESQDKIRAGLPESAIEVRIRDFNPDIVGITSSCTPYASDSHDVARIVKNVDREIKVVMGGAHPSANPQMVLKDRNIDLIVKGEGEITFLDLVRRMEKKEKITTTIGTITRNINGEIAFNPSRPYIEDLDSLPFPARHLLPMDIYFRVQSKQAKYAMRKPLATIITSRGCPGDCAYCAINTIWGRRWRPRSAKNVVDEIEMLAEKYGIREISFVDDNISVSKKRMHEICDEIKRRKIDIKWSTPNGVAIWTLDEKLVKKMKESGCYRLSFGLESGNAETLKFIGKNYNYGRAANLIRYANRMGLWTVGTFIIGLPYEKIGSIEDTINFAISSGVDFSVFYVARPLPGTRMYEVFESEGLVHDSAASLFINGCDTKHLKKEELNALRNTAYSRFLRARLKQPWRLLGKIRCYEDLKYTIGLTRNVISVFTDRLEKKAWSQLIPNELGCPF